RGATGIAVLELAHCTTFPLKIYADMGIAQFMFFRGDAPCEVSYAKRNGKNQNQIGITTARL
ncbi:dCTP deaminase, partial [Klebsiella pneumoniae]